MTEVSRGTTPALRAEHLSKFYDEGPERIDVLSDVSLTVERGEMVSIIGASGSGKSTLLHILGLLDVPDHGSVTIDGTCASGLSESAKSALRNRSLGFVYQFHHLLAEFSALDNVAMPLIVRRQGREDARAAAQAVLEQVGLEARAEHFPGQLSGGERQRVALARALVTRPACVLADEPTGNLDRHTAHDIYELLSRVNRESGTAFVIVTHDQELAARADRVLHMERGRLVAD
ncbi:lipoprotein-releasing ABC transporter ATP-binding protein LolD [Bordetella sp. FB-8]|uniref:lipoprotein-releasing ABC transporter ATP-binding protein LolD n=1 Tax=Bordetella sp. FB-8 TaxID=1159870 RepID=UPI00035C3A03|nr:lipoprotein-releasing ABC transporter ATP-binding protein LolD [Bordetella sp. FB-8]